MSARVGVGRTLRMTLIGLLGYVLLDVIPTAEITRTYGAWPFGWALGDVVWLGLAMLGGAGLGLAFPSLPSWAIPVQLAVPDAILLAVVGVLHNHSLWPLALLIRLVWMAFCWGGTAGGRRLAATWRAGGTRASGPASKSWEE